MPVPPKRSPVHGVTLGIMVLVALPSGMGVQQELDHRFRDFLDSWSDYNNGARVITGWIREGLYDMGVKPEAIPADADL